MSISCDGEDRALMEEESFYCNQNLNHFNSERFKGGELLKSCFVDTVWDYILLTKFSHTLLKQLV